MTVWASVLANARGQQVEYIVEDYRCFQGARIKTQVFSNATCVGIVEEPRDANSIWAGARHHAYSGWINITDELGTEPAYARLAYCQSKRDATLGLTTLMNIFIHSGYCDPKKSYISKKAVKRY